jgi:5-methylcytosine-specific restriction endonuclease McrA
MGGEAVKPVKPKRTTKSRVRSALRQLWMRCPERAQAIKRDGYRCQICGVKQSKAKGHEVAVQVHHLDEILWDQILDLIMASGLFIGPDGLVTLCKKCHEEKHQNGEK